MLPPEALLAVALLVLVYMTLWWLLAVLAEDYSIVDIAWGPGFILVAWSLLAIVGFSSAAQLVVTLLVTVWGMRLALHIGRRKTGGEDWRYAEMRKAWGRHHRWRSYIQIFLLQGGLLLVISLPILLINTAPPRLAIHPLAVVGLLLWLKGFWWESVADSQLADFKRGAKKGAIMTQGLWRYSRHPNYFGESLQWWALAIIALSAPGGWIALVSPLLLTGLLLGVSGLPLLEKKYAGKKEWEAYKERTSPFLPWFPKS